MLPGGLYASPLRNAFSTLNVVVKPGVASANSDAAGRSSFTTGVATRVNGRSWFWMIGVVSRRNGRVATSDGPSARAPGRSALSAGPASSANCLACASAAFVSLQRRRQQLDRALEVRVLVREALEDGVRAVDERAELLVARGERVREDAEVVDRAADVLAPLGQQLRDLRRVARGRVEAAEDLREVRAVVLQARSPRR